VLAGDMVDCTPLSKYPKDPRAKDTLADEVTMAQRLMQRLQAIPVKVWLQGNHEARVVKYIAANAPALSVLPEMCFEGLFRTHEDGFTLLPYMDVFKLGKFGCSQVGL
jgi:hypothetical protein